MSWDNYRRQDEYFEKPRESTTWKYFKIGLGLMLGMGTVWAIYVLVVSTFIVGTVNEMQVQTAQRAHAQLEKIKIQAQQQTLAAEQERAREARERADLQRQQMEAADAETRERQAKEAAWEQFYKKRAECENPATSAIFVECGNEYMRAQRKFEQQWEARKQQSTAM